MKEYKIYPLLNGKFLMDWGNIMSPLCTTYVDDVPIYCFLIEGPDGEKIMVDTGYNYDSVPKFVFKPYVQKPEEEMTALLKAHGTSPEEIKTVIITHLHHDHTGNMKLFTNAEFIVQEKELLGTTYPIGAQAVGVAVQDFQELVGRFRLIDGDWQLREGIDLILSPGHTEGHQAVAVNTSKCKAVIMGDTMYMYGGLSKRFPEHFTELLMKSAQALRLEPGTPEFQEYIEGMLESNTLINARGRYAGYFGPSISNPGENVKSISKLDMIADLVLVHHDAEMHKMKVIPDDYHLEGK